METVKKPQIGLRTLLILTILIAMVLGGSFMLYRAVCQQFGYGFYASVADWPLALRAMAKKNPELVTGIEPYGLGGFLDHQSIWRIRRGSPLLAHLLNGDPVEAASTSHPKAGDLIAALPYRWPAFNWESCTWYATSGFGSRRIEGTDLYLIAVDPHSGDALVYHELNF